MLPHERENLLFVDVETHEGRVVRMYEERFLGWFI